MRALHAARHPNEWENSLQTHCLPDGRTLQFDLRHHGCLDSPPVVFLNGLSQTTVAWGLQVKRLRGEKAVLLYDAAGQGRSSPPKPESRPADHAQDLLHLLDAVQLRTVDLCGFSFGARIALRLALLAPERVRRIVLIGCAHRETALRRWMVQGWLDALREGGLEHCFQIVTPEIVGESWLARNEHQRANMLRAFVRRNDPDALRSLLLDTLREGGDLDAELAGVSHPVLVCRGAEDVVVSCSLSHELIELLPDARYEECPDSGHSVAIEQPDWLTDHLRGHLFP